MSHEHASSPVLTITDGPVRTIRMNRPEAMNALNLDTKTALREAVLAAADDESVRCVVLTGSGRAFCVGQDLREHAQLQQTRDPSLWLTVPEHYNPIATSLATMPKPVIASINGVAAGAGAAFAFAADFRLMAASAGVNLAFAGIALSADSGSSWWLPRLVGIARAKELLLLPRTVPAAECLELGLVTEVLPDGDLPARTADLAGQLAAGPTVAYGAIRRAVAYSATHDLPDALAYESSLMDLTGGTADHEAAVTSFIAKQAPVFEGR